MKKLFEKKINLILFIVLIILVAVTIVAIIIWQRTVQPLKEEVSYDDKIICKNIFENISIDLDAKKVKRDGNDTTLKDEFGISEEEEENILSSKENLREFKKKVQEWYETLQSLRYKDVIVVLAEMNKYLRES